MIRATSCKPAQAAGGLRARLAGVLAGALACMPVAHATIELSDLPLFFAPGVDPNVFFEVDDSGSMDWEILTRSYWHFCDYDPDAPNDPWDETGDTCFDFQQGNGRWSSVRNSDGDLDTFEYIYSNNDAAFSPGCSGGSGTTVAECGTTGGVPYPYSWDWRVYSNAFNVAYYNPVRSYSPWNGPCMTDESSCTDASFSAARSDPREGKDGYTQTTDLDGFVYEVWTDDKGYNDADARPLRGGDLNVTSTPNDVVDLWDSHTRYTISGSNITVDSISYAPDSTGMNPTVTSTTLSGSGCFMELAGGGATCRSIDEVKQNVANWYQYTRKRQFVAKNALSEVISTTPGIRFGLDVINATIPIIEVPTGTGNFTGHNTDLLETFYDMDWPARSTPLRQGLERAGNYFDNTLSGIADPIEYSCQQNFTILLTDGYWNQGDPAVGNSDSDPYTNTVADVADYYYTRDLSPLDDNVPTFPDITPPDLNDFQHMVTFTVAFGVVGQLVDTDGDLWPNPPLTESSDWGDPLGTDEKPEKIDDLWHAAYNGRGTFLSARTPGAVSQGIRDALENIEDRKATASTVALNTGFISSDTRVYQARFDSTDWHGEMLSIPVQAGGVLDLSGIIDARDVLPAAAARTILTFGASDGVRFRWDDLPCSAMVELAPGSDTNANGCVGVDDTEGPRLVNYLRGDAANEKPSGPYRLRGNGKLGDFVNSAPVFVGAPNERYPDNWGVGAPESCTTCKYSSFRSSNQNRITMVYSGANDGMLHGFDGVTMVERLAYVPSSSYDNMASLADPAYNHRFFVDGTPTVIDAFYGGAWHTNLVGSLNKGGQLLFALDVTNPAGFAETATAAADVVMWEFSDADDADLGYTYSKPAIVRMQNGTWAAVFGNGYNSTENDGRVGSGHAVLFIVNLQTGAVIRKIDTGVGTDNGLSTIAPIDLNGDFIVDYIYGADLEGNVWKFNVTSSTAADWDVAFQSGTAKLPLFTAKDAANNPQPVTTTLEAGRGPNGIDVMLYFGTGKYLGNADITDTSDQTFYGIIDNGTRITGRSDLVAQTVIFQDSSARVTSANPSTSTSRGWYLDLPENGERVSTRPILRAGRIIFVTNTPEPDVCVSGGSSWLMELNALDGGRLDYPPFDNTSDGLFNIDDYIDTDGDGDGDLVQSGKRFTGIIPAPGILPDETKEYKFTPDSSGNLDVTVENPGRGNVGRQSWGQLR